MKKINQLIQIQKRIFLFVAAGILTLAAVNAQTGANIPISGVVAEANGDPVPGASVVVKGTVIGTATDFDGKFSLNVPEGSTLTVSFVGFIAKEIVVGTDRIFSVILEEESLSINEVVVIGYGSQTKKEITGSITSVKAENFNRGIVSNPLGLVQGKVPGLNIIKNGGDDPAQNNYNVQLRGAGSLNAAVEPLYVIDGVPGGHLSSVNPNDIESIDVLKDGSAAAIYGTRANAGVILITTKRGKGSAGTVAEYTGTLSTGMITNVPRVMNAKEFREKMVAGGFGIDYKADTDWIKAITRTPVSHTHNVAVSGSNEKFNYRASVGYKDVQGLAIKSDYEEINARFAANQKAFNNLLDLAYDFAYTSDTKTWANYDNFNQAVRSNPTMPIYSDDPKFVEYGGYYESDNFYTRNPVSDVEQTTNDQKDQIVMGSVRATLNLFSKLRFSTFYSIQSNSTWVGKYQNSTLRAVSGKGGVANQSQSYETQQMVENTLHYLNTFGRHNFQALLGQGYQTNAYLGFNASNSMFPLDKLLYNSFGMGEGILTGKTDFANIGSYQYKDKLASFFARVIYNFNHRYFLSASIRLEGSSKFGKKAHPTLGPWGLFPAVSGNWNIKEEDFLKDVAVFDELKLRVGYGVTGNMPNAHYLYVLTVGPGGDYVFSDGKFILPWGIQGDTGENESIRWEEKHEYNVGIDFAILKNRLSGSIDGYFRNTTDLLYEYNVPKPPYPYSKLWDNYGIIHNYGLELHLNGVLMDKRDLNWNIGFNASWNSNMVKRITGSQYGQIGADGKPVKMFEKTGWISSGDGETGNYVMRLSENEPIGNFYGFKYYGINAKGEWVFETPNGGYTTTPQDADKRILGNAQPSVLLGLYTTVRYKSFDFSANFRGQIGGLIFNETRYFYENTRGVENALLSAFEGEASLLTAWKTSGASNASIRRFSDFYLENAAYLKLNDLTIGYNPELKGEIAGYISRLRLTFTAQNILTITGYKGHDPSTVSMAGLTPGFDKRSYYPTQRSFNVGISFNF